MGEVVKFFAVRQKGAPTRYLTPGGKWTSWFAGAVVLPEAIAHRFELPSDGELFEFTPGDIIETRSYSEVHIPRGDRPRSAPSSGPVNRQQRRAQKRRQQKGLEG